VLFFSVLVYREAIYKLQKLTPKFHQTSFQLAKQAQLSAFLKAQKLQPKQTALCNLYG
jgi:hypothetical protein